MPGTQSAGKNHGGQRRTNLSNRHTPNDGRKILRRSAREQSEQVNGHDDPNKQTDSSTQQQRSDSDHIALV